MGYYATNVAAGARITLRGKTNLWDEFVWLREPGYDRGVVDNTDRFSSKIVGEDVEI